MRLYYQKLAKLINRNTLFVSHISTCVLSAIAFLHQSLFWLIFVCLIPLTYNLKHLKKYKLKPILRTSLFGGYIFSLIILLPILQPADSTWSQTQGSAAIYIKIFAWIVSSLVFSLSFLIAGYVAYRLRNQVSKFTFLLIFLLPVCELVRAIIFSIYSYGPGGSISPNFNLGTFGLAVSASPIAYLSRFIGLYGLSMVAVLVNIVIYKLLKKNWKPALTIFVPVLIFNFLAYYLYQPSAKQIQVAAVHLNEKETLEEWKNTQYPNKDTDLLVLPEYSLFLKGDLRQKTKSIGDNTTIVTTIESGDEPHYNSLVYFNKNKGIVSQQNKTYLIPSGEYIPYVYQWSLRLLKLDSIVDNFNRTLYVRKGDTPEQAVRIGDYKYGALACSGIVNLSQYSEITNQGAEILINPASLSFINSNSTYHVQEMYFAKFHAIANARAFVQSSRSGQSFILDSNGKIIEHTSGNTKLIEKSVSLVKPRTIYTLLR